MTRPLAALFVGLFAGLVLLSGCKIGPDDEMVRTPASSSATPTATPSQGAAPLPGRIPVGPATLDPSVRVWAQGPVLHAGDRSADVSPRRVDAFVGTRGGVYFLDGHELWFTDLSVVRATGLTGVTALAGDASGNRILVTTSEGGTSRTRAYDTTSGKSVPPKQ